MWSLFRRPLRFPDLQKKSAKNLKTEIAILRNLGYTADAGVVPARKA